MKKKTLKKLIGKILALRHVFDHKKSLTIGALLALIPCLLVGGLFFTFPQDEVAKAYKVEEFAQGEVLVKFKGCSR